MMKLFNQITHTSSLPPWAAKTHVDGAEGYWSELNNKHKVFLTPKNQVHLPKSMRGKNIADLHQEDFDALPPDDKGDVHYKLWREDFDQKRLVDKLFKDYKFTALGMVTLDHLKKYLLKIKLDDVSQLGLDPKFSIHFDVFDKMLATPQIDKVRMLLRNVAKKYRMIITLLTDQGQKKLVKKYDKDFYYFWEKLMPLAEFDPAAYKPKTEAKDREDDKETQVEDNLAQKAKDEFLKDCQPLLDPQMGETFKFLNDLSKSVDANDLVQAEIDLEHVCSLWMGFIKKFPNHPLGQQSEQILHLPSLVLLHNKLVGEA